MKLNFKAAFATAFVFALCATTVHALPHTYISKDIPTKVDLLGLSSNTTIKGLFYDDLPELPYVTMDDYLGVMSDTVNTTVSGSNYTITTASNPNHSMVVNPDLDTIYFADYTGFIRGDQPQEGQQVQNPTAYLKDQKTELIGNAKPVTLQLKNYNLDLRVENGRVYFPLTTLSDLFSISLYIGASYTNNEIQLKVLNDDSLFTSFNDSSVWTSTTRTQEMADHSYNELSFVMDYLYGKPEKSYLAKTISEKGFNRALKETNSETQSIYTKLHSTDMIEYVSALHALDSYLYDGGHTALSIVYQSVPTGSVLYDGIIDIFQNQVSSVLGTSFKTTYVKKSEDNEKVTNSRTKALNEKITVKTWPEDGASYYESGDTGLFVFDAFQDSVAADIKWALDHAVASGMKNFVFDLAKNGGGSSAIVHYILSIINKDYNGFDTLTMLNGNRVRTKFTVDKNLDGNFDELDDAYAPKLNYAIMTSKLSFSCGNLLPALARDAGIAILGEQSGGGTCTSSRGFYPNGLPYVISGFDCFINSNGEQVDAGVKPHYLLSTYDGFYDFASLSSKIHEYYGDNKTTETKTTTTTKKIIPLAPNSGAIK